MSAFEPSSSSALCTFALSNTNLVHQAIYLCQSCYGESGKCCCAACAVTCHDGHDVQFMAFGRAYCDCGCDGCMLARDSIAAAADVLSSSSQQSIALDAFGRIEEASGSNLIINDFSVTTLQFNNLLVQNQCSQLVSESKETFWLGKSSIP